MSKPLLAIINPAAGGGRCGRLAKTALAKLRSAGVEVESAETSQPGDATRLARAAYARGQRQFLAVGGDGTAYEIVNGVFPEAGEGVATGANSIENPIENPVANPIANLAVNPIANPIANAAAVSVADDDNLRPTLGFMPLGTGNSFLHDFTDRGLEYAIESIVAGRRQRCDVLRLRHTGGDVFYINLLSMGFTADVTAAANRRFKSLGELGYILGVLVCLARLDRRSFPLRVDGETELDRRRCLFLSFSNSKFTGGKMLIAPKASTNDGLVEYVRWGPIGRLGLLRNFPKLFDGTHIAHPQASRSAVRCVEFALDAPIDVMVDGEVLTLDCRRIDVLSGALDVMV